MHAVYKREMKAYFTSLDDAATAEAEVRRIHGSLKTGD